MALSGQLSRLGKQSAIYGLGGLVSRILAVLLLPLYTRYLSKGDYGEIETLIALVTVLTIILRFGISSAFFRFYFDADDHDGRRLVLRTSFWFTMTMATLGLVLVVALAAPISDWLFGDPGSANLVRASAVALWANMNYEQMTSLFRVEERPVAFVIASLTNVVLTIGGTVLLVVVLEKGPLGVIVGNFIGTLIVYLALLGYRREQLGLQMDRGLLRRMNHFGLPLVPSALFLWTTNFSDRFFLVKLTDTGEVGLYSVGVRVASAMVLLLTAFRTAWPAFAFSIKSDEEAKRTYAWVLTYLVVLSTWVATALALLSPWLVDWLTDPEFSSASRVVGPLAFAAVSFAGFIVVSIGIGRAKRTQFNWVITGAAAVVNVTLNLTLIPIYGMMGAAIATVAAYTVMFAGMAWWAQRIFPCPYQWRRVLTAAAVGIALATLGKVVGAGLPLCLGLIVLYPRRAPARRLLPARRAEAACARSSPAPSVRTSGGSSPAARIAGDRERLVDLARKPAHAHRAHALAVAERRDAAEEEAEERVEARELGRRVADLLGELPRRERVAPRRRVRLALRVQVRVACRTGHRDRGDDLAVRVDDDGRDRPGRGVEHVLEHGESLARASFRALRGAAPARLL